jgi:uncharacterized protein (TIGR01619 family)
MKYITFSLAFLIVNTAQSQQENWDVYLAQYEEGVGSTTLDMALIHTAPMKNLPYLLSASLTFKDCPSDGLPDQKEIDNLYVISDDIIKLVSSQVKKNQFVGTFTFQCERINFIYISDTLQIRNKLQKLFRDKYPMYETYISIKPDDEWTTYKDFLYPNEATQEYMANQKVMDKLIEAGDELSLPRLIDHWLYFSSDKDRGAFINYAKTQGFNIASVDLIKDSPMPYQLHISKEGNIDLAELCSLTLALRKKAKEFKGKYDGWESVVVKK